MLSFWANTEIRDKCCGCVLDLKHELVLYYKITAESSFTCLLLIQTCMIYVLLLFTIKGRMYFLLFLYSEMK